MKKKIYITGVNGYLGKNLRNYLSLKFDVRFLGDDYKNKPFTGDDLKIPIHYLSRDHGWSTTKFKNLIAKSI